MKPIYEPKGKAREYGDLACNIYTGCPHRCAYCYSPKMLRMDKETFHNHVEPRKDIVNAVRRQIEREGMTGKLIHLCFTCDPYPSGYDTTPTREIIKIIKESGNHVQILTKSAETRDFDLLYENDWFGVTITGWINTSQKNEPDAATTHERLDALQEAHNRRIKTWVSCEPVYDEGAIYNLIMKYDCIDHYKIGKLNYYPSDIDWRDFGRKCEQLCQRHGRSYYIKEGLRAEMEE